MNTTELGSRRLHVWRGRHHGSTRPHGLVDAVKEDTATLAEAIVEVVELFNAGGQLVQLDPIGKLFRSIVPLCTGSSASTSPQSEW
jgi:hypothetical protein